MAGHAREKRRTHPWLLAVAVLPVACWHAPDAPAPTVRSGQCRLEALIEEAAPDPEVRRCKVTEGVCLSGCAEEARSCILASARDRRPFVSVWTGNVLDGLGKRTAVVGQGSGATYRIVWLDESLASGYDPFRGVDEHRIYERIVSRECSPLVDLRNECGPDSPYRRVCSVSTMERFDAIDLGCVAGGEHPVCDE